MSSFFHRCRGGFTLLWLWESSSTGRMPARRSAYSYSLINTHMQGHCRAWHNTHTHTHGAHTDKECIDLWRELGGRLVIHLSGALRGFLGGPCHTPSVFSTGAQSFKRLPNSPFAILNYTFSPLHLYNFLIWLRRGAVKRAREAGESAAKDWQMDRRWRRGMSLDVHMPWHCWRIRLATG